MTNGVTLLWSQPLQKIMIMTFRAAWPTERSILSKDWASKQKLLYWCTWKKILVDQAQEPEFNLRNCTQKPEMVACTSGRGLNQGLAC